MQGENQRQWKKVNGNTYDISSIKKFLEVSRCSRAKLRKEMYKKSVRSNLLIRPIVVFHSFPELHPPAA